MAGDDVTCIVVPSDGEVRGERIGSGRGRCVVGCGHACRGAFPVAGWVRRTLGTIARVAKVKVDGREPPAHDRQGLGNVLGHQLGGHGRRQRRHRRRVWVCNKGDGRIRRPRADWHGQARSEAGAAVQEGAAVRGACLQERDERDCLGEPEMRTPHTCYQPHVTNTCAGPYTRGGPVYARRARIREAGPYTRGRPVYARRARIREAGPYTRGRPAPYNVLGVLLAAVDDHGAPHEDHVEQPSQRTVVQHVQAPRHIVELCMCECARAPDLAIHVRQVDGAAVQRWRMRARTNVIVEPALQQLPQRRGQLGRRVAASGRIGVEDGRADAPCKLIELVAEAATCFMAKSFSWRRWMRDAQGGQRVRGSTRGHALCALRGRTSRGRPPRRRGSGSRGTGCTLGKSTRGSGPPQRAPRPRCAPDSSSTTGRLRDGRG